jgi:hypothetical protein
VNNKRFWLLVSPNFGHKIDLCYSKQGQKSADLGFNRRKKTTRKLFDVILFVYVILGQVVLFLASIIFLAMNPSKKSAKKISPLTQNTKTILSRRACSKL